MTTQNKTITRRAFEEVWNRENPRALKELYAEGYVGHGPVGDIRGPDEFLKYLSEFRQAFPDLTFKVEDQIAEEDKVATRWSARGTHKGEFQGISPTGKQCDASGITIFQIIDGKVIEDWGDWDRLGLMQQLGVIPEPS